MITIHAIEFGQRIGFSFALKRTTSLTIDLGTGSVAKENAGLTTTAAAPAPNNWANLRREIEIVFI
ncbi:MAG: hypothetical protein DME68_04680 [Verrucomicrobia bacterium]|nr:MAG: hypothetical protein DME68_04680 [Verrucomicrobiota bacterium]